VSVCAQRCRMTGRKYEHVTPRFALVAVSGAHHVSSNGACLSVPTWSGTVLCQRIFTVSQMPTPVGDFDPHRRQRCSFHARYSRQLVTELSQLPLHALGTIYHPVSLQRPLCLLSERDSKPNCFLAIFCLDCLHHFFGRMGI